MTEIIFSDVDGVLTDSSINIGTDGELFKSFDVKDGYGIAQWTGAAGKEFVIVTARESAAVEHRAAELGLEEVHQGVDDKAAKVEEIARRLGHPLEAAAYIGDDRSDIAAMDAVGAAYCPADAVAAVRANCEYVSQFDGGDGAVRDIVDHVRQEEATVVGVIPARYGSTRLPGKPLVELAGKPMIQHVYERASRAEQLDEVIVATDHEDIADAVRAVGGRAMMTDPDHETGTDRVAAVATAVGADLTINIQGDEPLIDPELIDSVVQALREQPPRVATPIAPIQTESALDDENTVKVVTDARGRALYFSRSRIPSRGGTETTYRHIGLYGFETELLREYVEMDADLEPLEDLEQLRLLENGYEIQTVVTDYQGTEVNVESDIPVAERELHQHGDSTG